MLTDNKEILEQVSLLYTRFGIKSNTMDDVAGKLGISKKTLYHFFKDKEELVNRVTDYLVQKMQNDLNRISNSRLNAIEEMYQLHLKFIAILKAHSNVLMNDLRKYYIEKYATISQNYKQLLEDVIVHNIEKGKSEGFYRENIQSRIIARLNVAMIMSIPENIVISLDEYVSRNFTNEMFVYHLRGLINEESINVSNNFLKKINENKYVDHEDSQIN